MELIYDVLAPVHDHAVRDRALASLRREDPIQWDPENQWWLLTRHADIREASRNPEIFSSEPKGPWHVAELRFSMQAMDGKRHLRHRNVVSRGFTPRMVSMLADRAERYADEAIDALAGRSSCDFVRDLAVPVPMRIIADMLGVADGDLERFREWTDAVISGTDPDGGTDNMQRAGQLIGELHEYLGKKVAERRAEPQDDILSKIITASDEGLLDDMTEGMDGAGFDADEIKDMAFFLLMAGNETTRNAISQGMLALLQHPEQKQRLAADPSLWDTAADEILRWTTPVRAMRCTRAPGCSCCRRCRRTSPTPCSRRWPPGARWC